MTVVKGCSAWSARQIGILCLLWATGLFLRIPVLAVSPLAGQIAEDLKLSTTGTGALTIVPVVVLALAAPLAVWAIARIGPARTIAVGLLLSAVLSASRGWTSSSAVLFAATIGMGIGIAMFQTALPSAVRGWLPTKAAMGSAVYLNGMMVGELLGAGATLPVVMRLAGQDWRMALGLWAIPAAVIALLILLPGERAKPGGPVPVWPDWSDGRTWELGLWLAGSIAVFFSINAYMDMTLSARGKAAWLGALIVAYNATALLASLAMLWWKASWIGRRGPVVITGIVAAAGMIGFGFVPGPVGYLCALVAGFAASLQLILIMSLPPVVTEESNVARLTGGITFVGYLVAFALPLLGGLLSDAVGGVAMVFLPTAVFILTLPGVGRKSGGYAECSSDIRGKV
ncbi:MFS transporter [Ponticoccus gilvus]|nr:MFS transporter [Enemella evansiae]